MEIRFIDDFNGISTVAVRMGSPWASYIVSIPENPDDPRDYNTHLPKKDKEEMIRAVREFLKLCPQKITSI